MAKPKVFIASSREGHPVAEVIHAHIELSTEPTIWTHDIFELGNYPMEDLERIIRQNDFVIIVGTVDDKLEKRGESLLTMRDNLLIELGMSLGAKTRKRTFLVMPNTGGINVPSDILGMNISRYDAFRFSQGRAERKAALQSTCSSIRSCIEERWERLEASRRIKARRVAGTAKYKAVLRLYAVVIELRDLLLLLQGDLLTAALSGERFLQARNNAADKVDNILRIFRPDAEEVGAENELESLCEATKRAILEFPVPMEFVPTIDPGVLGVKAISMLLEEGDPLAKMREAINAELERKVAEIKQTYTIWWSTQQECLQRQMLQMQDSLTRTALEFGHETLRDD